MPTRPSPGYRGRDPIISLCYFRRKVSKRVPGPSTHSECISYCSFLEERATKREHALILGIAAKYQATRVLRRVMAILSHDYPDTLEGYDHWMKDPERRKHGCHVASRNCGTNAELHALFLLMNVARKSGMRVLLPAIHLILMSPQGASDEVLADWDKLGILPEDAFSIVAAKRKLDSLCRTRILFILYGPDRDISESCLNPDICHSVRHDIIYLVDGKNGLIEAPFQNIRERAAFYVTSLCENCKDEFARTYTEGREESWEELPSILGLGSWEDLRAARAELLATAT